MTEQELIDAISGHVSFGNMQPVMDAAKAYADAQVDAAVGRAMNEIGRISVEYNTQIAAKDTEIAELKEKNECDHRTILSKTQEVGQLNAEIKRLREFAQQCHKSPEKLVLIHYFENGEFDYCDLVPLQDAAINSLSPAPVTEGYSIENYPKITLEQLTENDGMSMMERLEKRMPPFHGIDSPKNEDQE